MTHEDALRCRKAVIVWVYRSPRFPDCTNGGISGKVDELFLLAPDGAWDIGNEDPALIFRPEKRGPDYWAAIPMAYPSGMCGPMDGGNFAYNSDARCPSVLHVHDRFETWADYNTMSM